MGNSNIGVGILKRTLRGTEGRVLRVMDDTAEFNPKQRTNRIPNTSLINPANPALLSGATVWCHTVAATSEWVGAERTTWIRVELID